MIEAEKLLRRHAIAEWRDRHLLAAFEVMGRAAQSALSEFDEQLAKAGLADTVWDPVAFAHPRVDTAMRLRAPRGLAGLFAQAAHDLRDVDPELSGLADALQQSYLISMPLAARPELTQTVDPVLSASTRDGAPIDSRGSFNRAFDRLLEVAGSAVQKGTEVLDTVQERVGLRDRARAAASDRVVSEWLGESGEAQSVLQQVVRVIEQTTETARMSTL